MINIMNTTKKVSIGLLLATLMTQQSSSCDYDPMDSVYIHNTYKPTPREQYKEGIRALAHPNYDNLGSSCQVRFGALLDGEVKIQTSSGTYMKGDKAQDSGKGTNFVLLTTDLPKKTYDINGYDIKRAIPKNHQHSVGVEGDGLIFAEACFTKRHPGFKYETTCYALKSLVSLQSLEELGYPGPSREIGDTHLAFGYFEEGFKPPVKPATISNWKLSKKYNVLSDASFSISPDKNCKKNDDVTWDENSPFRKFIQHIYWNSIQEHPGYYTDYLNTEEYSPLPTGPGAKGSSLRNADNEVSCIRLGNIGVNNQNAIAFDITLLRPQIMNAARIFAPEKE